MTDLIYAWDVPVMDERGMQATVDIFPRVDMVKVGKQLFTAEGPRAVRKVHELGGRVFLDLKYCDIPNTVAGAVKAACRLGVAMVNVHAMGGRRMMEAAAKAAEGSGTKVIAVTLLTSLELVDLEDLGFVAKEPFGDTVRRLTGLAPEAGIVRRLTRVALESGLDGVVCSPQEAVAVNEVRTIMDQPDFLIVTPAVRPAWAEANDQKRMATPAEAKEAGATAIVVGRPISAPPPPLTPLVAMERIREEIA